MTESITFRGAPYSLAVLPGRNAHCPDREIVELTAVGRGGRLLKRGFVAHRLPTGEIVNVAPVRW